MLPRLAPAVLLLLCGVAARGRTVPAPVDLFAAADFAGWSVVTAEPRALGQICSRTPQGAVAVTGTPTGYLQTRASYENYRLVFEYRWPASAGPKANGGLLLHIASGPVAPSAWPTCIQLQTKVQNAGDLLPMFGATFAEPITTPAKGTTPPIRVRQELPSERPLGEWNTLEVTCRAGAIEVVINGVLQNSVTQAAPCAGPVGFQLEGAPYELRNVRLAELPAE